MKEANLYIITFFIDAIISLIGWTLIKFTRLDLLGRCIILCAVTSPAIGFTHYFVYAHFHPDPMSTYASVSTGSPDTNLMDPLVRLFIVPLNAFAMVGPSVSEGAWELNCVIASFMWTIAYTMLGWLPIWFVSKKLRRLFGK